MQNLEDGKQTHVLDLDLKIQFVFLQMFLQTRHRNVMESKLVNTIQFQALALIMILAQTYINIPGYNLRYILIQARVFEMSHPRYNYVTHLLRWG